MSHSRAALLGLGVVVLALVLLLALAWGAIGEPWPSFAQPKPQVVEVEVPVAGAWIVLALDQPVRMLGNGGLIEACITYTTPAGTQETCKHGTWSGGGESDVDEAVWRCFGEARIGDPLPACWR